MRMAAKFVPPFNSTVTMIEVCQWTSSSFPGTELLNGYLAQLQEKINALS
jgi:hypothetical protein